MSEVQLIPDDDDDDNAREMLEVYRRAHKAEENVRQFLADWSDDDAAIRDLCRPVLGGAAVDGDSDDLFVLPLVEAVRMTIEKLMAVQPLSLVKRLDELRPQIDGPGCLMRNAERDIIAAFLRDAWNIPPTTEGKP